MEITTDEKTNVIVEAAAKRFAYYGFSKVTMDEIAADVGMAKASLYYYFPSKELLFKSVVQREQKIFFDKISAMIMSETAAGDKVNEYVRLRLEYFRELVNIGSIMVKKSTEGKAIFSSLVDSFLEREKLFLTTIFTEGEKKGEFLFTDVHRTAELFLHILQGIRLRTINEAPYRLDDDRFEALQKEMKLFVAIFIKGIKK